MTRLAPAGWGISAVGNDDVGGNGATGGWGSEILAGESGLAGDSPRGALRDTGSVLAAMLLLGAVEGELLGLSVRSTAFWVRSWGLAFEEE